jgi:hypothetical protein
MMHAWLLPYLMTKQQTPEKRKGKKDDNNLACSLSLAVSLHSSLCLDGGGSLVVADLMEQ